MSGPAFEDTYDVVVVGGGHAGAEAAAAAARLGARTALVTSALETIGQMSCNPAVGGVAKGTVVREVDALGGVMGRATDRATVQFRMLNRGKGPAVWSPRAQCDRGLYRRAVRALLEARPGLVTLQGTVARLVFDGARVVGLETLEGRRLGARAVVITTGTFLRGRLHIGTTTAIAGGRAGEGATTHLAEQLEAAGLTAARFKTGTPPRIDGRSVDFGALLRQESELADFTYRWSHFRDAGDPPPLPQLPCWQTYLEAPGKALIAEHLGESAMYGGAIGARGPRYCPSVEDKIVRFPEAVRHQLFLEPEGLDTSELYVNGLSTSLPAPVQLAVLRTVRGLERAVMTRAGYAIEYDYYPPTQLDATLRVRALDGLWLAGQINGTTGYEEAAGQGVVAGLNAGLAALGRPPLVLGRESSYIGVLVDDLVTRGVDEPYRLFTSRSEFRLTVRQDNALRRLSAVGEGVGLYTPDELAQVRRRLAAEDETRTLAERTSISPAQAGPVLAAVGEPAPSQAVRVAELARRPAVSLRALLDAAGVAVGDPEAAVTAELELKYAGYLARERAAAARLARMAEFELPADLPYAGMRALSTEARQKLEVVRPRTLAQAGRVPGVSPSDLQNLMVEVERRRRGAGSGAPWGAGDGGAPAAG
ncbi:tRNA uridine-5-carboxymethylaminomethyl(34) synthesis enzyme MnmG [Roseisolibacter sp. H3M3-2]|uniref:tRNA uridine-5-carboxymethylaminomethyl(34) synthesis enzyme MnmG n=1 Tax=Roseisolibacter sp. H3M3-2 TaxID=3031323 RepID=UPI0023DA7020|nr:tRNA uridine-5-carboxymethylaminomethyl(34) synthesis enzyme MnmG [Roseisolibacter sp. H3M3-2]MDF1506153.1 tRNA uridine-5-carboxymethylaminomethyl(34) synthesis enzyme MnmG [Roseisolibacter sp. H3M3-2]